MLTMFSDEHESDASSTTSEVPETPHTPRGIDDRLLLYLYTAYTRPAPHAAFGVLLYLCAARIEQMQWKGKG